MKMLLTVALEDREPFDVAADLRDFREWEMYAASCKPPLPLKPGGDNFPQMTWVTRLAFTAARRADLATPDWAKWQQLCVGVDVEEQSEEDPTQPDQ